MITSVKVANFQSLVEAAVELGTLTIIVGPNDLGKSALFRAIKAAAEASSGVGFVTYGKDKARVLIEGVDDHGQETVRWKLLWEKGAKVNHYVLLTNLSGDENDWQRTHFEKVGREVPPEVDALLSMSSVEFDKDLKLNLNFADQEDPPFLVPFPGGMTTTAVAKVLGDLTKLNVLFRAVGIADTKRKRAESDAKIYEADVSSLEQQLEVLGNLDQKREAVERLESSLSDIEAIAYRLRTLEAAKNKREHLRYVHEQNQSFRDSLGPIPDLSDLDTLLDRRSTLLRAAERLRTLGVEYVHAADAKDTAAEALANAELELSVLMHELELCPLCDQPLDRDRTPHLHPA